jgi:threonylcarbamoyladenosine tRNA methylthiotransferase MtaB
MNFAFYTLGCKVNQYETAAMERRIVSAGHRIVSSDGQPDVFVINSCTVTAESDRKTRQLVRKYRRLFPHAVIVLTGCMPQAFPDDAAKLDAADVVLGNSTNERLTEAVERYLATGERVCMIAPHQKGEKYSTPTVEHFYERTRAYLKIEDGCDRFCSYCIIPTARGRVRSKPIDEITAEVTELAANGHKEIVLVGINLSSYGSDIGCDLCDAVDAVCAVEGVRRVRLGSLEPDLFTDDMLRRLRSQDKLCPQFHLSLQSGCDATLRRMNRHYDSAFYADLVERIRREFDSPAITTDIMVGFAGETDDEFAESLEFCRRISFSGAHVFAYSHRIGTVAANAPNQVPKAVKEQRSRAMIAAMDECKSAFLQSHIGRICPVLFESGSDGVNEGYTADYVYVKVLCDTDLCGEMRDVLITQVRDGVCFGELV